MIKALQAAGITALILLGAWAAETAIDRIRPRTGLAWRVLIFFGIGLLIFLLSVRVLSAHDNPTDWIGQERRTNADKQLCCGEGDCHPFTVDQVKVMPDGYHFPDGEVVPSRRCATRREFKTQPTQDAPIPDRNLHLNISFICNKITKAAGPPTSEIKHLTLTRH